MYRGLFNLKNIDSMGDDDIVSLNINESGEFDNKTPDVNHPEVPFETGGASGHQTTVPGVKETPSAKPHDNASVSVPGGVKETPSSKPEDVKSIPVPSKVTLTSDEYNDALAALKKSFKEGYEIMEMLENVNVIDHNINDEQNEFVENAILVAMESGPMFEAVTRDDKDKVKEIVSKLRPEVYDYLHSEKVKFYKPSKLASALINQNRLLTQLINERLWQNLGVMIVDDHEEMVKKLNEKFKDELGDYKIVHYQTSASIVDLFRVKLNIKNFKNTYMLLVDKKFPSDLKKAIDEDNKNSSNEENDKKED